MAADLAAVAQGQPSQALAREGTGLRWWLTRLRQLAYAVLVMQYMDYTSPRTLFGLPLVQIKLGTLGPRRGLRRAKAWIAIGEVATGVVAFGAFSVGVFSSGGFALGGLALGGFGFGLASFAGISGGGLAVGGMTLGIIAVGGMACGVWATGGMVSGIHAHSSRQPDPVAMEFFRGWVPWL